MVMKSRNNHFRFFPLLAIISILIMAVVLAACNRISLRQIFLGEISVSPVIAGQVEKVESSCKINLGDQVLIEYSGHVEGEIAARQPHQDHTVKFVVGEQETFPALEKAVIGMQVNETKHVKVPAEEAFGPYYQGLEVPMPASALPPGIQPVVGDILRLQGPTGRLTPCTIVAVTGDSIWVDMNHPLAGKDLDLNIRVAAIN